MGARICQKDCPFYNNFQKLLNLCRLDRDPKLKWPYSDQSIRLGQPCYYGFSEDQIQQEKRARESALAKVTPPLPQRTGLLSEVDALTPGGFRTP